MLAKQNLYVNPLFMVLLIVLHGCGFNYTPKLSEAETTTLNESKYPFGSDTMYNAALRNMGQSINATVQYRKVVQSKEIGNTAGGNELPYNLTNMVINSVSEFAGPRLVVAPYDPQFVFADFQTGGKGSRVLPDIVIGGSITEFDKDVEDDKSNASLDVLATHKGEAAEAGAGKSSYIKKSRVVLDLYLIDYKTHAVIPGMHVSNTIHVHEISKDQDFRFHIWGANMGIGGSIDRKQGFHKAMRTLVEYSVLQLFGKYYDMPYWQLLGMKTADPGVIQSLAKTFRNKNRMQQVQDIQRWLTKYNLGAASSPATGKTYYEVPDDGYLDPATQAFIDKFIMQYAANTRNSSLEEIYIKLVENGSFPSHVTTGRPEDISQNKLFGKEQLGQAKETDTLILLNPR